MLEKDMGAPLPIRESAEVWNGPELCRRGTTMATIPGFEGMREKLQALLDA
ncbi:MAG: hypothetical protein WEB85_14230 [Dongiaceae bacterium]